MRRRDGSPLRTIITLFIIFSIFGGGILKLVAGLAFSFVGLFGLVAVIAGVAALLKKHGYTEVKQQEKPTKNPYSVNYNKEEAEKAEAERRRRYEQQSKPVVDTTYREVKEEPIPTPVVKPSRHKKTGDAEIDRMVEEMDKSIDEMKRLDEVIEDERLSDQIVHLESVTEKIVDYIISHPKKKKTMGKFFDYYLPTTIKLLKSYEHMNDAGISGTNIDSTKEKVENMMDMALAAFDKQLDALYADEALDVSTDITVMQNMLKSEGLTEDDITLTL